MFGAVEASALRSPDRLVAKVNIANVRVADSDKKVLGDAECEKLLMRENGSIEHVGGPFARERTAHVRRQGSNVERKPKCDSNPSDGLMPGTGLRFFGGAGRWTANRRREAPALVGGARATPTWEPSLLRHAVTLIESG
jgi:hypothetical protein